ncbi:zincin-like metallopeptidase domain-containing protein [Algivirga pacifica]|uniref:DUF1738 domain-containing protein n=1 Tax=Algivirga pacifica TaxID=1162670 RepID=A0ABP9DPQ9_9BACT
MNPIQGGLKEREMIELLAVAGLGYLFLSEEKEQVTQKPEDYKTLLHGIPRMNQRAAIRTHGVVGTPMEELVALSGKTKDVYEIISNKILEKIKEKGLFWRKPWKADNMPFLPPVNFASGKPYSGMNQFLLAMEDKDSPYWMTFRQVEEKKGRIREGSKSAMVIYYELIVRDPKGKRMTINEWNRIQAQLKKSTSGREQLKEYSVYPALRYYRVFNAEDIEGIEFPEVKPKATPEGIASARKIIEGMPQRPQIKHGGSRAFYSPSSDYVQMPPYTSFDPEQAYYATLFHELVHSTKDKKRLNQPERGGRKFGDHKYAQEELVAEVGAAFLCGEAGILFKTIDNTAAYVKGWSQALVKDMEDDHKYIFKAISYAQKAADYILNKQKEVVKNTPLELPKQQATSDQYVFVKAPQRGKKYTIKEWNELLKVVGEMVHGKHVLVKELLQESKEAHETWKAMVGEKLYDAIQRQSRTYKPEEVIFRHGGLLYRYLYSALRMESEYMEIKKPRFADKNERTRENFIKVLDEQLKLAFESAKKYIAFFTSKKIHQAKNAQEYVDAVKEHGLHMEHSFMMTQLAIQHSFKIGTNDTYFYEYLSGKRRLVELDEKRVKDQQKEQKRKQKVAGLYKQHAQELFESVGRFFDRKWKPTRTNVIRHFKEDLKQFRYESRQNEDLWLYNGTYTIEENGRSRENPAFFMRMPFFHMDYKKKENVYIDKADQGKQILLMLILYWQCAYQKTSYEDVINKCYAYVNTDKRFWEVVKLLEEKVDIQKRYESVRKETLGAEKEKEIVKKKASSKQASKFLLEDMPLEVISTDTKRFQNRTEDYSKTSKNKIIQAVHEGTFDWAIFDPITVWYDKEKEVYVVISGHSRLAAFKVLSKKNKEFSSIPVKVFKGTEKEAIHMALNSNTLSTKETEFERANYYRNQRKKCEVLNGPAECEKKVIQQVKEQEGKNANKIINLSYLNPKGYMWQTVTMLENSDETNRNIIHTIADWTGEARNLYPQLTNAHESEIARWLIEKGYGTKASQFSNKRKFLERLKKAIDRKTTFGNFEAKEPLNIAFNVGKSSTEEAFDSQYNALKAEVEEAKKILDEKRQRFYQAVQADDISKAKADQMLQQYIDILNVKESKLNKLGVSKNRVMDEGKRQGSLFGVQE